MKTKLALIASMTVLGMATATLAQEDKKNENNTDKVTIRVRMIEEKDGKTETVERSYTYKDLTEAERELKVKAIIDSLKNDKEASSSRRLSIEIEEGSKILSDKDQWGNGEHIVVVPRGKRIYRYDGDGDSRTFSFDNDAFADRMKRIEKDITPQMRKLERSMESMGRDLEPRFREFWHGDFNFDFKDGSTKPASIRGLEAFSNNTEKEALNLRFYAPNKGDVTISVTDTKGKQVGQKVVKDFSGDFVGQVEIGKNAKGTYFVSVVQNEDGVVKRVVID